MARPPRSGSNLPSEADILAFIADNPDRAGKREIARAFNIKGADRIPLKRLLRRMAEDGLIKKRNRRIAKPGELPPVAVITAQRVNDDGVLICAPEGWDVAQDGPAPLILLDAAQRNSHGGRGRRTPRTPPGIGARILARLSAHAPQDDLPAHYSATIIRVLEASERRIIGVVRVGPDGKAALEPADKKERRTIALAPAHSANAGTANEIIEGELVEAELSPGGRARAPVAHIVARHGKVEGVHAASMIAIAAHDLPHIFPPDVIAEADAAAMPEPGARTDLRDINLITIDPADARDRDDAVWAAPDDDPKNPGGHKLVVAIADVAHFVAEGSPLDAEARNRGNSVYFPDRVIPMLPEKLSNGLCSLSPEEDRAALAVEMIIDAEGRKRSHRFMRAMIRCRAALSYTQAQDAIDGHPDEATAALLEPVLKPLWAAYGALAAARDKRAPLALELPERKIVLDDTGHIQDILVPERRDAHRLVEEFMIQANVCAAETLERANRPVIFRVHEPPSPDKLETLTQFLKTLDLKITLTGGPQAFNRLLERVEGKEIAPLIHQTVLRAQSQAIYSTHNDGHFGLNLGRYAHFTSPIRRYADLCVHRALIAQLDGAPVKKAAEETARLETVAAHISTTERRAMAAERDTIDRLCAAFLAERIGARFSARISGITRGAMFITLDETGADGIIPASSLAHDFFRHDEKAQALVGAGTGEMYRLGDSVEVKLLEAAPVSGGLRFEMISAGRPGKKPRSGKGKKGRHKGKKPKGAKRQRP